MTQAGLADARILIVDDQEPNVRLLERILAASGFRNVRGFGSSAHFLAALPTDEPDLVLLDLHMPPPDGYAVLTILHERTGPAGFLPVLVLTADADRGARSRALSSGAKDFLVKPFDAEEVVLRVKNLLETRALHVALQARNADLADEVTALRARELDERRRAAALAAEIRRVIARGEFTPVFQPIVRLADRAVLGYEALTRFADGMPPDRRFAAAADVGLGLDLESATLGAAIREAASLTGNGWLSLNVSPDLVLERHRLASALAGTTRPTVLEITEHVPIADYDALRAALRSFGRSVRSAVDDAGAGHASFRHILEIAPAFVKLDIGLVRSIDRDPARQALAAGMVFFAKTTGCELIAEGVETAAEAEALVRLGMTLGQGYLLGRPAPVTSGDPRGWMSQRGTPIDALRTSRPRE